MRVERQYQRRSANLNGVCDEAINEPRVTAVDAVEVADRYGTAAEFGGQIMNVTNQSHGSKWPPVGLVG
jgi:hypothetical protein